MPANKCEIGCTCGKHKYGPDHPQWKDRPGMYALHKRVRKARGRANTYSCVDCGRPAREWSQIHDSDAMDVNNFEPRCRSCHLKYDYTDERKANLSLSLYGHKGSKGSKPCQPDCLCGKHFR